MTKRYADFRAFVGAVIRERGTAQAVADGIDMSLSAFSRGVRNEGTLGVENLLRLAEFVGASPSEVLRLAGKVDVADIIERLYGEPRAPLSQQDRTLIALDNSTKKELLRLVAVLEQRSKRR